MLLDEPTEGRSPAIVPSIVDGIASICQLGRGVFLAESNLHHVPDFAERHYVIVARSSIRAPADVRNDVAIVVASVVTGEASSVRVRQCSVYPLTPPVPQPAMR